MGYKLKRAAVDGRGVTYGVVLMILSFLCVYGISCTTGGRTNRTPEPVSAAPRVPAATPCNIFHPIIINPYYRIPERTPIPKEQVTHAEDRPKRLFLGTPPAILYVSSCTVRAVTAYNAGDQNQCDSDPCISANGENICEAISNGDRRCAANFVPFGTHLYIENLGECLVTDRMHPRFNQRVDIAMDKTQKKQAIEFGLQYLKVKIMSIL